MNEHIIRMQETIQKAVDDGVVVPMRAYNSDARRSFAHLPFTTVSADYDEFKPETFRGFVVTYGDNETRHHDLESAREYAQGYGADVMYMSSVDNYQADLAASVERGSNFGA